MVGEKRIGKYVACVVHANVNDGLEFKGGCIVPGVEDTHSGRVYAHKCDACLEFPDDLKIKCKNCKEKPQTYSRLGWDGNEQPYPEFKVRLNCLLHGIKMRKRVPE